MGSRNGDVRLMSGNEACAEGAILAGCRFYAGYPITPSTEIAEALSRRLPQVGGVFIQMEDEIASMAAVIGASVAGVKAMTATSGPGFSLMQENIGYAAMAEIPCVIVDVMRGGPSTGLPTKVSQGDVMQARWGSHGDRPGITLCSSSVRESLDLTVQAFNLSEKYRVPVILLIDEVISHLRERVVMPNPAMIEVIDRIGPSVPPEWYIPYDETPTGVPPLASFGEGYRYNITGLTHDQRGFPTNRPDEIKANLERIMGKIEQNRRDLVQVEEFMLEDAEVGVFAYGSTARSAKRAVKLARNGGTKVGLLRPTILWPFPKFPVNRMLDQVKAVVVPEMNFGQIVREVERVNQGRARIIPIRRIDSELFTPEEILDAILEAA